MTGFVDEHSFRVVCPFVGNKLAFVYDVVNYI